MPSCHTKWLLLATAGLALVTAANARADLSEVLPDMGDLERWAVLSLGDGNRLSGNAYVYGEVGVAGTENFTMGRNATIEGNLYCRNNSAFKLSGHAKITDNVYYNEDPELDNSVIEAIHASD